MNITDWIKTATRTLRESSSTPTLDTEVLLMHVLGKDKAWLLAHPEHLLDESALLKLRTVLDRRLRHEPIAYIIGKSEFYGRSFEVSTDTLQPRPETETMIEMCLAHFKIEDRGSKFEGATIVDVGTGSGCIITSIALELASELSTVNHKLFGIDISKPALKIAKRNAKNHGANVKFIHGDLLSPVLDPRSSIPDLIILANLPYVPNSHTINEAARHEPDIAIFGGDDGLDLYRSLFEQSKSANQRRGSKSEEITIYTESLPPQHDALRKIALSYGFVQTEEQDFIQVFKLIR